MGEDESRPKGTAIIIKCGNKNTKYFGKTKIFCCKLFSKNQVKNLW